MKLAIPIAAITLLLSSIGAHADGTWCAQYGGTHGGTNCGFYSFQQCEAARSGNGGFYCGHRLVPGPDRLRGL